MGELGAGDLQQRAALLDIARDVVEIGERQQAAARVAIEDHEVELAELDLEQLARGERDQRQLADRRAVLLLGRAQDRKVHQVDRRVGLEQVAPHPQARIGLARDQQHAQPVAHAVDEEHLPVVARGQLAGQRLGLDLEHRLAGPVQLERHRARRAGLHAQLLAHLAVLAQGDGHRLARTFARQVVDAQGDLLLVAHHAVARHLLDQQPTVLLVALSGQQQVQRRVDAEALEVRRHVVDLAVGQDQDAREARAIDLGQGVAELLEQPRAALAVALHRGLDQLERVESFQGPAQLLHGLIDLRRPVADLLRGRAVDQQHRDVVERLPLLADHHRIGERQQAESQHGAAPDHAARTPPQPEADHGCDRDRECCQQRPRQQRHEAQRGAAGHRPIAHWPSRSSSAGTCTWSVL